MLETVLSRTLTEPADTTRRRHRPALTAAVGFRAVAPELEVLSAAERQLIMEWLDRAIAVLEA